jgi:nucleoside-diphosphate-sugar epimerase
VRALEDEHDLTLTDIRPPDQASDHRWAPCNVVDLDDARSLAAGHEAVVHTVALVRERFEEPLDRFIDVMVKGTWNIAQASAEAQVRRLINISSIVACGWPETGDRVVTPTDAFELSASDFYYSLSKRLGEQIINAYSGTFPGLAGLNLRPGVIAGDGKNPEPSRDEAQGPYWFVHVDVRDVARAVRSSLATEPAPRGTYAIVAGREDALFDWQPAAQDIGYVSEHTWPAL